MLHVFSVAFYFVFSVEIPEPDHEACACFFNVGQGHCFFFGKKDKSFAVLIDAGSSSGKYLEGLDFSKDVVDVAEKKDTVQRAMRYKLSWYIDAGTKILIILTHGDKDHYNWLDEILFNSSIPKNSRSKIPRVEPQMPQVNLANVLCVLGGFPIDYCEAVPNQDGATCLLPKCLKTQEFLSGIEQSILIKGDRTSTYSEERGNDTVTGVKYIDSLSCPERVFHARLQREASQDFCSAIQQAIGKHLVNSNINVQVLSADVTNTASDKERLKYKDEKNKNSIVTRLEYTTTKGQKVSFMIAGDVPGEITDQICTKTKEVKSKQATGQVLNEDEKKFLNLQSTVLLSSHHGAGGTDGTNNDTWLQAVSPRYIVNSHAMTNYGHPHKEIVDRMQTLQLSSSPAHPLVFGTNKDSPTPIVVFDKYKYFLLEKVAVPIYSTCTQQHICFYITDTGMRNPVFAAVFTDKGYIPIPHSMGGPLPPSSGSPSSPPTVLSAE